MARIKVPIQVNLPDDWIEQIVNRLRNDPEAEWVEIVRCKDCKHWLHEHQCIELSEFGTIETLPNEFCSRAERRIDGV
jgi:hypothetical protein